jgi:cell shape-determining protein MreD
MIATSYIFIVLFISVMLEVIAGSSGVIIPLTALAVFYFSMVYGWKIGLFLGFVSGLAVDMLYGRVIPVSALSFAAVSVVTVFWLLKGETKDFYLHIVPGILTAAVAVTPVLVFHSNEIAVSGFANFAFLFLFSLTAGAFCLPFLIIFLDMLSEWLGMDLYRTARENIEKRM